MRTLAFFLCSQLSACCTFWAVANVVGTVAVLDVETVIDTVDANIPDAVNKDD